MNSLGMKFQLVPPGEFRMGSEDTYLELVDRYPNVHEAEEENPVSRLALESARPQHVVRVTRPYYLGAYEVTNAQFQKFADETGRKSNVARAGKGGWGIPPKDAAKNSSSEGRSVSKRYWGATDPGPATAKPPAVRILPTIIRAIKPPWSM